MSQENAAGTAAGGRVAASPPTGAPLESSPDAAAPPASTDPAAPGGPHPSVPGRRRAVGAPPGRGGDRRPYGAGGGDVPPSLRRSSPIGLAALLAGVAALGWVGGRSLLIVVGAIVVTIVLHELGHYLTAKWSGMKVTEFFLGFGPRIWSLRRGETDYGVKVVPAGAYVKIIGMNSYEEVDPADEARTYRQQSYPWRLAVAVAGSAMHFLIAIVLILALLVGFGTPGRARLFQQVEPSGWTVTDVVEGSAAAAAGLQVGDRIMSVDGTQVPAWDDLGDVVRPRPGQPVTLVVERDGQQVVLSATLTAEVEGGETIGRLGVRPSFDYPAVERHSPLAAVPDAARDFGYLVGGTVSGMAKVFSPSGMSSFARQVFNARQPAQEPASTSGATTTGGEDDGRLVSIIGATRIGARLLDDGAADFLRFMVVLNVFIGLFNLVPLLPLDGGHVAIATYERIREIGRGGRRYFVDVTRLLPITYAVVTVLVLIGLSSIYLDVVNPISIP